MLPTNARRVARAAALAWAGLTVATAAARAQSTSQAPVRHPEITELKITGVHHVEIDELQQSIATQTSRCRSLALKPLCWVSHAPVFYERHYLSHQELARDAFRMRVFYFLHGYRETTVDTTVTPSGRGQVHVRFAVHEGPATMVDTMTVQQRDSVLSHRQVVRHLRLHRGEPLDLLRLDTTQVLLRQQLWDAGYADAVVDTAVRVNDSTRTAAVTITLTPRWLTRVASIAVRGNTAVSARTIRKSLSFAPGDIFRRSTLLDSQRRLYESNLFRRVAITVPRTDDSLKHVSINVQEAPPRVVRTSVGFSTVDFAQLEGRFTDYNWMGGAKQLDLVLTVGNLFAQQLNGRGLFYNVGRTVVGGSARQYLAPTYTASANFRYPWLGSPNNTGAFGIFAHRRSAPGIYVDRGYGASATFTRTITPRGPLSLTYQFEETKVDAGDVYFCINFGVCDRPTLNALRRNQRLSPLALTLSLDKTDDPFEPRTGFRTQGTLEHASSFTFSDFRYNRATASGSYFFPIGRYSTIGVHAQLGWVNPIASTAQAVGITGAAGGPALLHPRKRFYAGGANSVRGFGEGQLGPRVLTVPPAKLLLADSLNAGCTAATIQACNPNGGTLADRDFVPRPLGGDRLAEGSIEFRFPVLSELFERKLLGAVFVDAGILAQTTDRTLPRSKAAVTPGFGVRYLSPVGPIRVDVGINPQFREQLPVVTQDPVTGRLVRLAAMRSYQPVHGGGITGALSRLTLHLSIGEAF